MKKQDLLKKNDKELVELEQTLKKELFTLRSGSLAGEDSKIKKARIKTVKRDLARVKTKLNN